MRRRKWRSSKHKKMGVGGKLLLCLVMVLSLLLFAERQLSPIIMGMAAVQAHRTALAAVEASIQQTLAAHPEYTDYQQLVFLEKNNDGHVTLMIPNIMRINDLVATTMLDIQQRWEDVGRQSIAIPLGSLTGSTILAGLGPEIRLSFVSTGAPELEIHGEFASAGINQTRHRIWLDISGEVLIAAPFSRETVSISSSMLLAESVIVGPIPDTYLSFTR